MNKLFFKQQKRMLHVVNAIKTKRGTVKVGDKDYEACRNTSAGCGFTK